METANEPYSIKTAREDGALFNSLLRHVVQAPAGEDTSYRVLESIGRLTGAVRCCVYRFTDPGKSRVCSIAHEWFAEGSVSAPDGRTPFDLAAFEDLNASIAAGCEWMSVDGSPTRDALRARLERLGVGFLIAAPLSAGGLAKGFASFGFAKAPDPESADRTLSRIRRGTDILLASLRLHERNNAVKNLSQVRELNEKTIETMRSHESFRADALEYAFSKDDLPGLMDMMLHRLLELTECDYIALHSSAGDHLMLHADGVLSNCPGRCESCAFYKLAIPPEDDPDHVIELPDTKGQSVADIPCDCPAKSLEVAVVHCDGKPWGGIALHYLNRQSSISRHDRDTLKISANVLTMALERRSAADRLKAERDRVVESEKVRSYFFSSVSHDIRTPLNAIIGFSELLQAGGVPPDEAKQNLKMIVSSGKALLQLVNDVLDISKMDLGKLEFKYEPTLVGEVVRETSMMFLPQTRDRNQTIVADIPDMPRLMVDPYRFRQVLFNFISNAVKYAGPCTIRVSVVYENGLFKTTVSDNGRGVPAEKAKRLMQPFVQADIKNRAEGCGLGLAICKRLVELANGTISIDTSPGKGFTVRTEVPVVPAPGETDKKAPSTSEAVPYEIPKRVLAVDDSPVNRSVLKAILKKIGVGDIVLAVDGAAALEILEKDASFDWVLTDMWMPVVDGAELVKRMRSDARLSRLKVCSVTADVEALSKYREQGFDSILLKPVTIESLKGVFSDGDSQSCDCEKLCDGGGDM